MKIQAILFLAATCLVSNASAQLTLTGTSYAESFDSVGTQIPTGWSVTTSATASTLGTAATFDTTVLAWSSTSTGGFRNIASANIAFTSNTSSQSGDTNRALGWRPTSPAERNGAVTLQLTNTTGFQNFSLSFDLFTANDVSGAQTYVVEYRVGNTGSFTQIGSTYTTPTTGASTFNSVSYSFISTDLAAINDQNSAVFLRIRGTASSGSGNLDTIGLDNFSLSYSAVPEPSTYAALAGLAALGLVAYRRKTRLGR